MTKLLLITVFYAILFITNGIFKIFGFVHNMVSSSRIVMRININDDKKNIGHK